MKSQFLARLLVLSAALAISLTPGCRRKAQTPITPLGARTGATGINNPPPVGPSNPGNGFNNGGDRTGRLPGDNGARATDLGGSNGGGSTVTPPPPGDNVALSDKLERDKYNENRSQFAADVVYFDFDSAVVKTSEKTKIGAIADFLRANAAAAVEVEGHCDERGTEEYNRSLGEKRALAVREEIAQAGIDPKRIFTISYGEDRPAVNGHDESSWGEKSPW